MGNALSRCFGRREKQPKVTRTSKSRRKSAKLTEMEIAMFAEPPKESTYMGLPVEEPMAYHVSDFCMFIFVFIICMCVLVFIIYPV